MQQFNRLYIKIAQKRLQRVFLCLLLIVGLALSACGQKGELFLPTEPPTPSEYNNDN